MSAPFPRVPRPLGLLLAAVVAVAPGRGAASPVGVGLSRGGPGAPVVPPVTALAVAPDGAFALAGSSDGRVRRLDLAADLAATEAFTLPGAVVGLAIGPGGTAVAVDDAGHLFALRPAPSGLAAAPLPGHEGGAQGLALAPDGSLVATAGTDGAIRVVALDGGELRAELRGHDGPVAAVAFGARALWSAGWDGTLRAWDLDGAGGAGPRLRVTAGPRELSGLAADPGGGCVVTACFDGQVRSWETVSGRRARAHDAPARAEAEWVSQVRVSGDGGLVVAVAPPEQALLVLDPARPERQAIVAQAPRVPSVVDFLPGGATLLVGYYDGGVDVVAVPALPAEERGR